MKESYVKRKEDASRYQRLYSSAIYFSKEWILPVKAAYLRYTLHHPLWTGYDCPSIQTFDYVLVHFGG